MKERLIEIVYCTSGEELADLLGSLRDRYGVEPEWTEGSNPEETPSITYIFGSFTDVSRFTITRAYSKPLSFLEDGESIYSAGPEPTQEEADASTILYLAGLAKRHGVPLSVDVNVVYENEMGESDDY